MWMTVINYLWNDKCRLQKKDETETLMMSMRGYNGLICKSVFDLINTYFFCSLMPPPLPSPVCLSVALPVQPSAGIADFTVMHRPPAPLTRSVLNLYLRDVSLWLSSFCPSPLSHLSFPSSFTWLTISSKASPLWAWSCSMLLPVKMDLFPSTVACLRVRWKIALRCFRCKFWKFEWKNNLKELWYLWMRCLQAVPTSPPTLQRSRATTVTVINDWIHSSYCPNRPAFIQFCHLKWINMLVVFFLNTLQYNNIFGFFL